MDRIREVRRSNMAAANGLPKRRQRSSSLRESHEEDGQMELQDTVRLRDRANKRDRDRERDRDRCRDREFSNHKIQNKRRRGDSLAQGNSREEEDGSTEESIADEEDYEIEERRVSHTNSHNTTSFSPSLLNQNSRKSLPPNRPVRQALALKAADELIGALVPRKVRSASVKRAHDNWVNGNGGFWEDHKASSSPASRSTEANSPSSSNVSVRKRTKPNGPKTRLPKVAKSSSSSAQQEEIEIEIAEVLYELMKQSQNTKEEDDNIGKFEPEDDDGIGPDSKSSVSVLFQNNSSASDPLPDRTPPKTKKVEADNPSNPVQNCSITAAVKVKSETHERKESYPSKSEITYTLNVKSREASPEIDAPKVTSMTEDKQKGVTKQDDSKPSINEESSCSGGPVAEKKSISAEEESTTCLKMDLTVTKSTSTVLENESRKEEKFEIDLMAPPPMVSSPERDGFKDFASDPSASDYKMKSLIKDEEKAERSVKMEPAVVEVEEKKIEPIGDKRQLKIDLEKPNQDNEGDSFVKLHQQIQKQQQLQPKSAIAKVEKTALSSSVPLQPAVAGWPNGLLSMGYLPPFQRVMPMDGSTRPATAQQPSSFMLSQPRPKRCATHWYIARNICLNQQVAKMNTFWPTGAGSASASVAKPSNLNVLPSAENLLHGNPVQGGFPVLNLNSGLDKGQVVANFPGLTQKDKSSEGINFMDSVQRKQLVPQAPQPGPAGNLLRGPAFIFPVSQQQAAETPTANQPGPSKCAANSTKSSSLSGNSMAAVPASSTALPAVSAAVSYNYPNLAANETPYLTILQSNGYPFSVPTPIGTSPAIRGGTHAQTLPFFSGSFYSSQIFHPSQLQHQQQPHSQPLMQAAQQNTSTSSGSSPSHKQLHCQQPRGAPVSGNNFMNSACMQLQQPQKQLVSSNQNRKLEAEVNGENTQPVAVSRPSHSQTSVYGQNFSVPFQPLNFALMSSPAVGGRNIGGNHSEKQKQSQQKSSKGGVELIPQAFAMSFASFGGSNSASNLNFSSMPQNPAIFQNLPDMARQVYQVAPAAQSVPQKNHQISEMKTGGGSSNHDDSKKPSLGKSSAANEQTIVFDDSTRTLNFVSAGNWPSRSTTSTAITTNVPIATNSQNFQQQQMLQLKQQSASAAAQIKAPPSNSLPLSAITAKLSNTASIFQQTLVQGNSLSQSPQWKNSTRKSPSQVPPTTLASSNTPTLKNVSQQQVKSPPGHTQISFERHSKSGLAPQLQQMPTSNQLSSAIVVGSPPSGGNLRTTSTGSKAGSSIPTLQSQQTENSSASTGQKSSPVCGRNVPSILSACPSHLSELEY